MTQQHERFAPDDPREWINRARSNLSRARIRTSDSYLEDPCLNAQQAAEMAIKAVMIARDIESPYVHDLDILLSVLEETGETIPDSIRAAGSLTPYALVPRYLNVGDPVTPQQYEEAVEIAEAVIQWAQEAIRKAR